MSGTFYTFIRSCTSFETMARARKKICERGLTRDQARQRCDNYNRNLTPAQIKKGTKMEFDIG